MVVAFADSYCSSELDNEYMPLRKRRRLSKRCSLGDPAQNDNDEGNTSPWRPTFLHEYPGADVVLRVNDAYFKVHKERLTRASVLADMFELPQPVDAERVDGCPLVPVYGDEVADWEATILWLYEKDGVAHGRAQHWPVLKGALRISTKYAISNLRDSIVASLCAIWPETIFDMDLNCLPNAAEAITLARECNVPQILPSAFYALSVQRWSSGIDNWTSHLAISASDLRRLIAGRESVQEFLANILVNPLYDPDVTTDGTCAACQSSIASYWRAKLAPDANTPWTFWISREMKGMLNDHAFMDSLCDDVCFDTHDSLLWARMRRLNESVPRFFLLA
ncbi:hypothetical protein BD626DRAFT_490046 [Schizophyllum amplum]|uniref:BTB domain-containing protein n=1 Tax=Schizophyllum amplum TaxID=97359 RepID=A0A550CJ78_9AGAR|nr:hypothetical protein BD626DRAFT_490046 [Auriculariopsis ampla]